jgi:hypothetical protein
VENSAGSRSGESGPNLSNVARHRYVDDFLRSQIAQEPNLQIVLLGCGFDSRAFRLNGGTWWELDEPRLIAYKDDKLPASQVPNPLRRISIELGTGSLQEKLQPLSTTAPTVVVIEGITMYLPGESLTISQFALLRCSELPPPPFQSGLTALCGSHGLKVQPYGDPQRLVTSLTCIWRHKGAAFGRRGWRQSE